MPKELIKVYYDHVLYEYDHGDLLLSVTCGTSAVFTMNYLLTEEDKEQYKQNGPSYIARLASRIQSNPNMFEKENNQAREWLSKQ
ncbi:MAG: hypothetical protein R2780_07780 [Crocinitomicaceae bacterium]|nr:hypothetical protein [Crocinitomicaceae bacterium]